METETLNLNKIKLFDQKITAFGHGNMGSGTIDILLKNESINRDKYTAIVHSEESRERLIQSDVNSTTKRVDKEIEGSDIILLAYKQDGLRGEKVYENMKGKIVISLIAGITENEIGEKFKGAKIVRAMPNRGSVVGEGCTFLKFSRDFEENEKDLVKEIFQESGDFYEVERSHEINQGTVLSASMLGIIALFKNKIHNTLKLMDEGDVKSREFFDNMKKVVEKLAIKYDFLVDDAHQIANKTFEGLEKLSERYEYSDIQKSVTSRNGTTHAMVEYLESINIEGFLTEVFAAERILEDKKQQEFVEFLEKSYLKGLARAEEMAKG